MAKNRWIRIFRKLFYVNIFGEKIRNFGNARVCLFFLRKICFEFFTNVFRFKVIFCKYFGLWYFIRFHPKIPKPKIPMLELPNPKIPKVPKYPRPKYHTMSKIWWDELEFCITESKILRTEEQFCLTVSKICEVKYKFISQFRKFCGVPPVYTQLFELRGCFLFNVIFCEYFDLRYFILSAPIF